VLTGKGKIQKEIVGLARTLQQHYIAQVKEHMTIPQLKMAMKVSQRALLDGSLSLSLRG
jgi:16S rRNA U516 pseudouridylate synthase RsuA-like enzyme